jgi:hypothetical protein
VLFRCQSSSHILTCRTVSPIGSHDLSLTSHLRRDPINWDYRRNVENDSHCKLGRGILLPAILLHGAFDSVLFIGDFLNAEVWAVVLALLIFVAGVVYYFREAKKQRQRLQSRDLQVNVDQSSLI